MKKTLILSVAVLFFSFLFTQGVLAARKPMAVRVGKGTVKVNYLDGSAQVRSTADAPWKEIKVGHILRGGDEVEVAKGGRLELLLPDNSALRFAGGSLFKINAAPDEESRDVDVHLTVGKSWAKVQAAAGIKRKFGISTENAVAGVRGTVYRVNAEEDKSVLVRVYEGEVEVTGKAPAPADRAEQIFGKKPVPIAGPKPVAGPKPISMEEWTMLLKAMQQVVIRPDGSAEKPRTFTLEEDRDDWVDWNRERDENLKPNPWGKW
ncbi:MAG TPA: FecR family protein [Syntrophales bacterium]|nr:FecR family protein [Syntrophales bacterium]HOL59970.1 FecR family protein [Syntrophales bacterium]HPO36117.1 FecR family protein [Syntrophales bacterium]